MSRSHPVVVLFWLVVASCALVVWHETGYELVAWVVIFALLLAMIEAGGVFHQHRTAHKRKPRHLKSFPQATLRVLDGNEASALSATQEQGSCLG